MRKIRLTSLFTALVLAVCTVSFPGTVFAANSTLSSQEKLSHVLSESNSGNSQGGHSFETRGVETRGVETRGAKSLAIKTTLKDIASGLRGGSEKLIKFAGKALDKQAVKVLSKNLDFVADAIDGVPRIPDLAEHVVKEKPFYALRPLDHGNAMVISDAVTTLVSAVVL